MALATHAVAGDRAGRGAPAVDVAALRARYHDILTTAVGGKAAPAKAAAAEIDRSFDELGSLLSSLVALKELTWTGS